MVVELDGIRKVEFALNTIIMVGRFVLVSEERLLVGKVAAAAGAV
jgi:hypothetical protein